MKVNFTFFFLLTFCPLFSQYTIYNDASTIITGVWAAANGGGTATLSEVTNNTPYEGNLHYQFSYNYSEWWAGMGLNLDNWGSSAPVDLSGYSHLRIAYRGLSTAGESMIIQLLGSNDSYSNEVTVGSRVSSYSVVDIPVAALISGTAVNMNAITGIQINLNGAFETSGTLYFDAIELVNVDIDASPASATTWTRANSVTRGLNTSNWLEAYWLIPFNAYPEVNKYNETNILALKNAGFDIIRLPVTFEQFTPQTAPYTIPISHAAIQLLDNMIAWAEQYDFKLIIDNHHGYNITDENFQSELPRLKAIWQQLSTRYGHLNPDRYFFEIYNEAHLISNNNLRTFYTEIVDVIRANETQIHSILIGATGYNSGYDLIGFTPLADADIIYTFHSYDPYYFTHQGMSWTTPAYFEARTFPQTGEVAAINNLFTNVAEWSTTWDVPVWLGEYGVSTAADATSRCNWIETMETAAQTNHIVPFYWDVLSPSDAFGFFANGVISEENVVPCFANAMNLYMPVLATTEISADIECDQNEIRFFLQTTSRLNCILQSSEDGINWNNEQHFTIEERNSWQRFSLDEKASYYRLQKEEMDGQISYSDVIPVPCTAEKKVWTIQPNPSNGIFQITTSSPEKRFNVQIFDVAGRQVQQWQQCQQGQSLWLDRQEKGVYLVKIYTQEGEVETQRLVVQ